MFILIYMGSTQSSWEKAAFLAVGISQVRDSLSSQSAENTLLGISDSSLNGISVSPLYQTYAHPSLRLRKYNKRRGRKNVKRQRMWKNTVQCRLWDAHNCCIHELTETVVTCKRSSQAKPQHRWRRWSLGQTLNRGDTGN